MGYRAVGTNIAGKLKTKRTARIGVLILIGGMLALITEAQYEPRTVQVTRVIDGDTIQVTTGGQRNEPQFCETAKQDGFGRRSTRKPHPWKASR